MMCTHTPRCPDPLATDHNAARTVADHRSGQGWSLRCNGVIVFDDGGEILPDNKICGDTNKVYGPERGPAVHAAPALAGVS